jgi:hypothetical protein
MKPMKITIIEMPMRPVMRVSMKLVLRACPVSAY